jgi:hypothetical protein
MSYKNMSVREIIPPTGVVPIVTPTVSVLPPAGTYTSAQSVKLTTSSPSTIYYTTDGSTPTTSSTNTPSPVTIQVSNTETLKFFAKDSSNNVSTVGTNTYTINYPVLTQMGDTIASYGLNTYSGRQVNTVFVSLTSSLVGKQIDTITVQLKKVGSPTGPVQVGVFNSDLSVKQLFGTIDSSSLSSTYKKFTFSLAPLQTYKIQSRDRIGIKFAGGSTSNNVAIMSDQTNTFDGTNSYLRYYTTAWQSSTSVDLYMILKTHVYQ